MYGSVSECFGRRVLNRNKLGELDAKHISTDFFIIGLLSAFNMLICIIDYQDLDMICSIS